jgi:diguanylate cyclase (GGDEF)-like protein
MDGDATQQRGAQISGETWVGLGLRIGGALAAGALAGMVADRIVAAGTTTPLVGLAAGIGVACLVGGILATLALRPLLRSRAELTTAYQQALADSLQDPLTRLGNHRAFQEELDRQVEAALRYDVPVSLAIIDLDQFKSINDGGGHADGDRALAAFGRLLSSSVRRADRCFRIGGDEFAVLLPHTDAAGARIVARRLLSTSLAPPLRDEGFRPVSFSAGIAALPETAATRAQLYSQADAALYAAKRGGRTEVIVFDPAEEAVSSSAGAAVAVAEVIARGQLQPAYQPIVTLQGGEVLGFEGLIRPAPPAPFEHAGELFAAAAAAGHLVELDLTCVELLVAGARHLASDRFLSINISPRTVEAPEFTTPMLLSVLARHGFEPGRLVMELTEREAIEDLDRVRTKLDACRRAGIRLAADDLGAGNAGLRLLSELRFDILKVDLSLVQRSAPGSASSDVVGSVVGLAARTGALVVGEGVEHPEQLRQLVALGVVAGQGYLLGRPGPLPGQPPPLAAPSATIGRPAVVAELVTRGASAPMAAWRQSIGLPT